MHISDFIRKNAHDFRGKEISPGSGRCSRERLERRSHWVTRNQQGRWRHLNVQMSGWRIPTVTGSLWLDWDAAANRYAQRHDADYGVVSKVSGWFYDVFQRLGPGADVRRARALPLIAQDPTRVPDVLFSGPEFPLDAASQARFFGEDSSAVAPHRNRDGNSEPLGTS